MCCCVREAAFYETKVLLLGMVVRIPRFIHIRGNGMGAKQKELGEGSSQLEIGFVEIKREVGKGRVGRSTFLGKDETFLWVLYYMQLGKKGAVKRGKQVAATSSEEREERERGGGVNTSTDP